MVTMAILQWQVVQIAENLHRCRLPTEKVNRYKRHIVTADCLYTLKSFVDLAGDRERERERERDEDKDVSTEWVNHRHKASEL